MNREEAIEIFKRLKENAPNEMHVETVGTAQELFDMAIQALSQEPTSEMVHVETLHQVMWERDIAIGQLKELGYDFGQKIEPCDDAISRDAVLSAICDYVAFEEYEDKSHTFTIRPLTKRIKQLPSVTQKGDVKNV